jgi:hypothetical protein
MNGHVFQSHNENASKNQFLKTVEALSEYINKNLDFPKDMSSLCKSYKVETVAEPTDLLSTDKQSATKRLIWETKVKNFVKRMDIQEKNLQIIFSVIWGQCSITMQSKLQSLDDFEERNDECDCAWIINEIKGITHKFEGTRYVFLSVADARLNFYQYKQDQQQPLHEYLKNFRSLLEVLEHYGATVGEDECFLKSLEDYPESDEPTDPKLLPAWTKKRATDARNRTVAILFLKGADRRRYGSLWTDLENQFSRGVNQYPNDLVAAYNLLLSHKETKRSNNSNGSEVVREDEEVSGMTFVQHAEIIAGTDGITLAHMKCFACNHPGHLATMCPDRQTEEGILGS